MQTRFLLPGLMACFLLIAGVFALPQTGHAQDDTDEECAPSRLTRAWPETDFCQNNIDFDTVMSGGVSKDQIPAVDDPAMESVEQASEWLGERSPVIAVEIDGEARAYPQAVLIWHEIANDTISDVPVSVTFCPLCNSSIVFDRRVNDEVLSFGVSGNLRNSDLIMYDRETESWWQQFTGEGIVGEYTDTLLDIIPSQVIGFEQFAEQYPEGLVMSRETGYSRRYGSNPYTNYDQGQPFLFRGEVDDRLRANERVLAGEIGGEFMAYPFPALQEEIVINDTLGTDENEVPVVAFWQPGTASALSEPVIDTATDIGTAALYDRNLGGEVLTFTWDSESNTLIDDQTGSAWNLFGEAVSGELEGQRLNRLVAAPHFWFAWAAFHPETAVYSPDSETG